jgi:ribosomal protein L40E
MGGFGFDILLLLLLLLVGGAIMLGWAVGVLVRLIWYGLRLIFGIRRPARVATAAQWQWCGRVRCGAVNPIHARYCRRCGVPLQARSAHRRERAAA